EPPTMAFRYSISDVSAIIHEYLGDETDVIIPAVIDGYPVTHIADEAFRSTAVTSVTIPQSVIHVGWFAFANCTKLTAVICTASVESIDYGAFDGCPNLTLYCPQNSYVARYAASFALRHEYT
ncbi:MAG: leucine-rich repeat protein, partial [Clostridia bacterium]|nr:leucine-rich repeat protein [Clostridia bacterium]